MQPDLAFLKPLKLALRTVCALLVIAAGLPAGAVTIASGVEWQRYVLPEPWVINVVKIDRSRTNLFFHHALPYGRRNYPARETTSAMAARYDNPPNFDVIAAVNAGFFGGGIQINGAMGGGNSIIQLPSGTRETLAFLDSGAAYITENVSATSSVLTFADGSTTSAALNAPAAADTITCYSDIWGASTGTSEQGVEVVLGEVNYPLRSNKQCSGIVTAVRQGADSVDNQIPQGGLVISGLGSGATLLASKVAVGQRLSLKFVFSDALLNNASVYMNGAGWLLKNGAPNLANWENYSDSSFDGVRHPRTAVAFNSTHVFLVVVDGRQGSSVGMTFAELASFLSGTLGATDAINLDGGGSSTMWVNGSVMNSPSDAAGERPVGNALLLVQRLPPKPASVTDSFASGGKKPVWDEKLQFDPVAAASPASPGGDGFALRLKNTSTDFETIHTGQPDLEDYCVEAYVYCEYRTGISGSERPGIFARDNGNFAWTSNAYGGGNCYAMRYDTTNGRIRAGILVNGSMTDWLPTARYIQTTGWHRFGICCDGSTISYYLDGSPIHSRTDTTFRRGPAGLGWAETFSNQSYIRGGLFDNFSLNVSPALDSGSSARAAGRIGKRVWLTDVPVQAVYPQAGILYAGGLPGTIGVLMNGSVTAAPYLGQKVTIIGTLRYADYPYDRELVVQPEYFAAGPYGTAPKSVRMANFTSGGAWFGLQPGVANSYESSANGLNTIGALVSIWGRLTQADSPGQDYVYIDDGAGLSDGWGQGIRVNLSAFDPPWPAGGPVYLVTGIMRPLSRPGWSLPVRELWPRYYGDIRTNP